jgi:hypothetical protein
VLAALCIHGCGGQFLVWAIFCRENYGPPVPGGLSLVSATEELLGIKSSSSDLESLEYGCRDPSR